MTSSTLLLAILLHPSAQAQTIPWASVQIRGTSEAELKVTDSDINYAGIQDGGG